ncbi:hypothetical protein CUMW_252670 [Citrus unshiu]|uniref:O-methyltransferase dimerisation domain-containing protein n=1 Tax=Citrus unshiu TaxID=55188 RepID=A0A2H5QQS5_CITUN|nr:hypothetical protein CUMW_252670 [Citrus unshiu]
MANEARDENFAYAFEVTTGSVLHMTMKAVINLGLFEIIAKAGPGAKLSASEIAAQLPATEGQKTHPRCWTGDSTGASG